EASAPDCRVPTPRTVAALAAVPTLVKITSPSSAHTTLVWETVIVIAEVPKTIGPVIEAMPPRRTLKVNVPDVNVDMIPRAQMRMPLPSEVGLGNQKPAGRNACGPIVATS